MADTGKESLETWFELDEEPIILLSGFSDPLNNLRQNTLISTCLFEPCFTVCHNALRFDAGRVLAEELDDDTVR